MALPSARVRFMLSHGIQCHNARRQMTRRMSSMRSTQDNRLFSGIQPTGVPHMGNYLGAVKNWVKLQNEHPDCIFAVADLHSLTRAENPDARREDIMDTAITLLACGIDPDSCILIQQSDVKEHAELCWILTCQTTEARLKQVPTWKEKAKLSKNYSYGLIAYPLLMAADIMLYRATQVPVGVDQAQNIQFCRDLAHQFNNTYKTDYFPQCDWLLTEVPRIRSLRNPDLKMSKSDPSEKSRINLDDDADTIELRIKQAVTDSIGKVYHSEERPGVSNLIDIHSALTGLSHEDIERQTSNMDTGQYKLMLADIVNEQIAPIRAKISELRNNKDFVSSVLSKGSEKASEIACKNLDEIKRIIGLK